MESSMSVTVGVDTHADAHVGVALDQLGRCQGEMVVPNEGAGYRSMLEWALNLGELACVGVEGTGSFGAGLSRFLRSEGVRVLEVNRVSRQHCRRHDAADADAEAADAEAADAEAADAEAAARAVLSGEATGEPKAADGHVEMLRALKIARRSAVKAK